MPPMSDMQWIALQPRTEPHPADQSNQAHAAHAADAADWADLALGVAWWALQFTPHVTQLEEAILLETSASARLFGGQAALQLRLQRDSSPRFSLSSAYGSTALGALGRLRYGSNAGVQDCPLDRLPLHTLSAARSHLATLRSLGCQTWGQLRSLPRGGVSRRFGAALLDALDRAYGAQPEVFAWLRLPAVFEMPLELPSAVESAPALLFGAQRLLAQLLCWLQARQRGVLALELSWQLDARRSNAQHVDAHHDGGGIGRLTVRTAQPTRDQGHLQRLLAEHLARVQLPAPVLHLHLRSLETQAMVGVSASWLMDDARTGDSQQQLVERLVARLGEEQVRGVQSVSAHVPELMQQCRPWDSSADGVGAAGLTIPQGLPPAQGALYPTWLLATPCRLAVQHGAPYYHGGLTLLLGPQRLECGWRDGPAVLRDYFVARSPQAGLLWIYRERLARCQARWYLHGLFA